MGGYTDDFARSSIAIHDVSTYRVDNSRIVRLLCYDYYDAPTIHPFVLASPIIHRLPSKIYPCTDRPIAHQESLSSHLERSSGSLASGFRFIAVHLLEVDVDD